MPHGEGGKRFPPFCGKGFPLASPAPLKRHRRRTEVREFLDFFRGCCSNAIGTDIATQYCGLLGVAYARAGCWWERYRFQGEDQPDG
jgi:hypothetical protein